MGTVMAKLDVNTASLEEIERIHGIGSSRAREIVETREKRGGIRHIDELLELPLFQAASPADQRLLTENLVVHPETLPVRVTGRLNLNVADHDDLERINGVGSKRADILIDYRRRNGHFRSLDEIDALPTFDTMDPVQRDAIQAHLTLD